MKIALVGYGYWGPNVAKNIYKNKKLDFCIICDKNQERLSYAKSIYANSVQYSTNFEDILKDETIELVALAVETSAHYELAKKALQAGKHIYVEKPFTESASQARKLKELAEKKKLIIHVDHIMVYHPAIKKIKKIIDSGEIGEILYFDCSRLNLGNLKNDVSSMWDLSVHDLSIIDYLLGGQTISDIEAMGEKVYSQKESITFLSLRYNTFLANIRSSWISPIKERKLIIAGTKKMIVYDDVDVVNKLIVYDKGFDIEGVNEKLEYDEYVIKARNGDAVIPKIENGDALYNSIEHFRECIEKHTESLTNADAAIRIIEILELADKKMKG